MSPSKPIPSLTPYDRARIAFEQVGAVLGVMRLSGKTCPSQFMALDLAYEELEILVDELEVAGQ